VANIFQCICSIWTSKELELPLAFFVAKSFLQQIHLARLW